MRFTGKTIRLSKDFKFRLSKSLLETLNIKPNEHVSFNIINDSYIVIQSTKPRCMVTGEPGDDVREVLPNIFLSKEGMEKLLFELQFRLKKI